MSDLSNRILRLIEDKGLSYGELAEMTNIPKSALQRYATGETEKIPLPRIEIIANALGVSFAYLKLTALIGRTSLLARTASQSKSGASGSWTRTETGFCSTAQKTKPPSETCRS